MAMKSKYIHCIGLSCLLLISVANAQTPNAPEKREPEAPTLSPDGRQIVYRAAGTKAGQTQVSSRELWIVNYDGTGARQLTIGPDDRTPRFSPDGGRVVFTRDNDVWLVNADGGGLRNVTNTPRRRESMPEFTLDGQSLVFLCRLPDNVSDKVKEAATRDAPMAAIAFDNVQSVVLRNLQTGTERTLLGDGYDVEQAVPVPADANALFMLCKLLDNNGKPLGGLNLEREVAVLKLDGAPPRSVFRPKGGKITLAGMRILPTRNFFTFRYSDRIGTYVGLLEDGDIKAIEGAPIFGDVTADGRTIVGVGLDDKVNWSLVRYDIATGKKAALGAPLPVAVASTTPVVKEATAPTPPVQMPATSPAAAKAAIPAAALKHFERGQEFFDEDDYDAAIAAFTKAIEAHPAYAEAYYYRGWTHDLNDDQKSALRDLTEAIRLNPKSTEAWTTRGQIHEDLGDNAAAMADYTAAATANPENYLGLQYRGELHAKLKKWDLAIADYTEVLKLSEKNLTVRMNRGDAYFVLHKNQSALDDYNKAIEHFPKFAMAYKRRAVILRAMGKTIEAAADEKMALELEKKS